MGKKLLRAALLAAALVLMLTTAAFAAEGDIHAVDAAASAARSGEDGYTVTYTNAAIADKQCVLLVVAGTYNGSTPVYEISESTIQYIDQKAADGSGSVSFTYIPKSTPDSLVLLGVEGQSGPILLATVESKGVTVSGTINLQGRKAADGRLGGATVTLTSVANAATVFSGNTLEDGTYSIASVAADTYTMTVEKSSYLRYVTEVEISDNGVMADITLYAGDVNGDKYVNGADSTLLLSNFGVSSGTAGRDERADINGDSYINGGDLSLLLSNFGKNAK